MHTFMLHFFGTLESIQNFFLDISIDDIGWLSTLLLTISGIPLLWDTIKKGKCTTPFLFVLICFLGESFGFAYVTFKQDIILAVNYGFNTLIYGIVFFYKIRKG